MGFLRGSEVGGGRGRGYSRTAGRRGPESKGREGAKVAEEPLVRELGRM
jgi:hypothetical protein